MWYNQVVIDDDWIVVFAHNLEQFSCQELWIKNLAKTFFQNDYPLIIFYLFARVVHSWKYYSLERNIPWANEGFICHLLFSLHFSLSFSSVHRQSFPLCIKLFLFVFMCFLSFVLSENVKRSQFCKYLSSDHEMHKRHYHHFLKIWSPHVHVNVKKDSLLWSPPNPGRRSKTGNCRRRNLLKSDDSSCEAF